MFRFLLMACLLLFGCNSSTKNHAHVSTIYAEDVILTDDITVIFFFNIDCPICRKYSGSFRPIIKEFGKESRFYFLFPGNQSDKAISAFCDYDSIPRECIVKDADFNICKTLGAEITPQVLIFKNKELKYSGKID